MVARSYEPIRRSKGLNPGVALIAYTTYPSERIHHIFDVERYGFEALVIADLGDMRETFSANSFPFTSVIPSILWWAMLYVGLTGNIASGKSEAATWFGARGATIVDADVLARDAVAVGAPAYERVVARWGPEILSSDGSLDREALRHTVFADKSQLDELNAIVHPGVNKLRRKMVAEARKRGDPVLIYVVPLLFERRLANEFDQIILVDAPRALRLERLVRLRGVSEEDAANMISAQMLAELKRARADFVIENDGSLDQLHEQVDAVWDRLTAIDARPSLAV